MKIKKILILICISILLYTTFNANNILEYAEFDQNMHIIPTGLKVMNIAERTAKEKRYLKNTLKASDLLSDLNLLAQKAEQKAAQRVAPADNAPIQRYPLQGRPTSLVILVNFQDIQFTYTRENFDSLLNQKKTSFFYEHILCYRKSRFPFEEDDKSGISY